MTQPLNAQDHLSRAIKDIQYVRRYISGNEELISADEAIMHIRKAMELMRQPSVVIESPVRRRERVSRFATGRQ
jgi:hypothetical protein